LKVDAPVELNPSGAAPGADGERTMPKVLATFPGSKLDRLECCHAWLDRPSLLMVGEHVTLGGEADAETELDVKDAREKSATSKAGTGCVHTAPGHGHDDFVLGKQYGLEVYCPVDNAGKFTAEVEHFAGLGVFEANPKIVEFMRERGVLLFSENYEHRYPHCWRCKNPVIFRATPQWFVSMDRVGHDAPELDEDGRDQSNFTNFTDESDTPQSLRAMALREIKTVKWIPAWGQLRMHNMLAGRPDWCVSRQRVWGVPIPAFYCSHCNQEIADAVVIRRVADIFEKESADAWYKREARELLPEGFVCPGCGANDFTKETDILDVWFDSGSSSIAVLENREGLRWPADVYIEGADQYRGWFNSSLMVGLAVHDRAPYKTVLTHGWTVDAHNQQMHKSTGNAVAPDEVIKNSGADILRLWCASAEFTEDMRSSPEILERVSDGYRKIRNTARYALGNLDGFDLARDGVEMLDAPISGGPARAHAGTLSMMAAGSAPAFERGAAVIDAMAAKCFRMGAKAGDGSRMKVVNNMLAASNIAAGCEAMAMAAKLGIDLAQAADVINASSGASWMFADRMARALVGDYAPSAASRVLLKDVGLFVDLARSLGLAAPMAEQAREVFLDTVARGYAEEDDAAVLKRYADLWRVDVPR